jgi:hypothetical protein
MYVDYTIAFTDISLSSSDLATRENDLEMDFGAVEITLWHVQLRAVFGSNRLLNPVVVFEFRITRFYMEIIDIVVLIPIAQFDRKFFGE